MYVGAEVPNKFLIPRVAMETISSPRNTPCPDKECCQRVFMCVLSEDCAASPDAIMKAKLDKQVHLQQVHSTLTCFDHHHHHHHFLS